MVPQRLMTSVKPPVFLCAVPCCALVHSCDLGETRVGNGFQETLVAHDFALVLRD